MVKSCPTMSYQRQPEKLARLSAHLDDLFLRLSCPGPSILAPELADEIAATAGEVMGQVIEGSRRLREAVRTACPEPARVAESGRTLVSDLELVIREDRHAA